MPRHNDQPPLTPDQQALLKAGWKPNSGSGRPNGFWRGPDGKVYSEAEALRQLRSGGAR